MTNGFKQHKIFVVDDQCLIREGLVRIINRQNDLVCCGTAESIAAAHKHVAHNKPDLLVADLLMQDGSGLEMIKNLKSHYPSLLILVISQCDESLYAERALMVGARGYVMKNRTASEILTAIKTVLSGEFYVSHKIVALALQQMANGKLANRANASGHGNLSNRELEIFQLLGGGMSSKQISARLHISIRTVETHRENIKHKLNFSSSAELVCCAAKWVDGQDWSHCLEMEFPKQIEGDAPHRRN